MTGDPLAVLAGRPDAAGLVRWRADRTVGEALAAARAAGWRADPLDLQGAADKAEFMARCADSLGFPEEFGRNWDALRDLLTDTGWLPRGARRLLLVTGWQGYAAVAPGEWRTAERIFGGAADHGRTTGRALLVLLAEPPVTFPGHPTPGTSG